MTTSSVELSEEPSFEETERELIEEWRENVIDELRKDQYDLDSVASSVSPVFKSGGRFAFEVNHPAAEYLEFGTEPHEISVNSAEVLSDGSQIFGTTVQHPGTRAVRFMRNGREKTARQNGGTRG